MRSDGWVRAGNRRGPVHVGARYVVRVRCTMRSIYPDVYTRRGAEIMISTVVSTARRRAARRPPHHRGGLRYSSMA
ncbi:hypothetical protein K523DRAFT_147323 [Schizophyllum commune Tattone D]|nr:hypothetical protein K523DRAFT_147323 [Schizophyllum commune Tattone D]